MTQEQEDINVRYDEFCKIIEIKDGKEERLMSRKERVAKINSGHATFSTLQNEALYKALHLAAEAFDYENGIVYDFMESTPRASFIAELSIALDDLGYRIVEKSSD